MAQPDLPIIAVDVRFRKLKFAHPQLDLAGGYGGYLDGQAMRPGFLERFEDGFPGGASMICQSLD